MMTPAFYKSPSRSFPGAIALKPRSAWRQALLDAAYRDIDACTCHTDFVFAIVDHSKAWLAELNQWNKVPTKPDDLAAWETFTIIHPRILLQGITLGPDGYLPKFWSAFGSNVKPGQCSLTGLPNVLPWTRETAIPYEAGSLVKTVYAHTRASGSGGLTNAHTVLSSDVALKYIQCLTQYADTQPYKGGYFEASINLLERRSVFAQTHSAKMQPVRKTWLGRRLDAATHDVQNAHTLREVARQVTAHMPTWYAAAHKWENWPPEASSETAMLAYQADLKWSYRGWVSDKLIGVPEAEGPSLRVEAIFRKDIDFVLLAKVLRQVPLGVFMDTEASEFAPDWHGAKKEFTALCMDATASSAYCALGRSLIVHRNTRVALGLPEDSGFHWHEQHSVEAASITAIAPIFDALDL